MTNTEITPGSRVRVVHADYNDWTPDDLKDGDRGLITRLWRNACVDFKRDDGRMFRGLLTERFEVIAEEKEDAMKYRFILTATKAVSGQYQSINFSGVILSLKANTLEEAEAAAIELLPDLGVPGHYWSFQPQSIEEL